MMLHQRGAAAARTTSEASAVSQWFALGNVFAFVDVIGFR